MILTLQPSKYLEGKHTRMYEHAYRRTKTYLTLSPDRCVYPAEPLENKKTLALRGGSTLRRPIKYAMPCHSHVAAEYHINSIPNPIPFSVGRDLHPRIIITKHLDVIKRADPGCGAPQSGCSTQKGFHRQLGWGSVGEGGGDITSVEDQRLEYIVLFFSIIQPHFVKFDTG